MQPLFHPVLLGVSQLHSVGSCAYTPGARIGAAIASCRGNARKQRRGRGRRSGKRGRRPPLRSQRILPHLVCAKRDVLHARDGDLNGGPTCVCEREIR